jgi:hypothetical protein
MKIEIKRIAKKETYTIGKMYIDGKYFCDTLEDTVRPLGVKIAGKTAIPAGTYKVILAMSPRFKRILPRLLNVLGFDGVLIHRGNTDEDTAGCILVGENTVVGRVVNSARYEMKLVELMKKEKEIKLVISD